MIRIKRKFGHTNYRLEAPTYDNDSTVCRLFDDIQLDTCGDDDAGEGWGLIIDLAQ